MTVALWAVVWFELRDAGGNRRTRDLVGRTGGHSSFSAETRVGAQAHVAARNQVTPSRSLAWRLSRKAVGVAVTFGMLAALVDAGVVSALAYDGTNPATTACGNGSQPIYTLGSRVPPGSEGVPTPIYYGNLKIGTVEIRHSAYCATVWSRVTNLTGSSVQVHETIVLYSDSNGSGRTEYQYPTTDTVAAGGTGYSNQYRDRPSFSAKGGIYYAGAWRWSETVRSIAWAQYAGQFPNTPFGCNHTSSYPCQRWPTLSSGLSATFHYYLDYSLSVMPHGPGTTIDVEPDLIYMFGRFNSVAASNPFFYSSSAPAADVDIYSYYEVNIYARGAGYAVAPSDYYSWGEVKLSTWPNWASPSDRSVMCQEFDHLMGLNHVEATDSLGIENVGSKATCVGANIPTGPSIDDVSALNAAYGGSVP